LNQNGSICCRKKASAFAILILEQDGKEKDEKKDEEKEEKREKWESAKEIGVLNSE
jgi:hypothetical protein